MFQKIRQFFYQHGYMNSPIQKLWVLLQNPFMNRFMRNKIKKVCKNGEILITEVNRLSNELHINCWLEFGTLLGAYRDKSFISFDYDIDMGMYAEDYTETFKKEMKIRGFHLIKCFYLVDEKKNVKEISEVTYKYKGIYFDIFLSHKYENYRAVCVYTSCIDDKDTKFKVKQYLLDNYSPGNKVYINNIECLSPSDPHKYLSSIYGKDYMTPIQGWKPPKNNPIVNYLDSNQFYGFLYRY